jgi:hypothetical protein
VLTTPVLGATMHTPYALPRPEHGAARPRLRQVPDTPELRVVDSPSAHRFEAWSGSDLAGFAEYRLRPGRIVFTHTEIDGAFEGKGIGSRLAAGALDQVRSRGLAVVPLCPFIKSYIDRHPEYAALVIDS